MDYSSMSKKQIREMNRKWREFKELMDQIKSSFIGESTCDIL